MLSMPSIRLDASPSCSPIFAKERWHNVGERKLNPEQAKWDYPKEQDD